MKRMIALVAALCCGIVSASAADLGSPATAAQTAGEAVSSGFHFYITGGAEFADTAIAVDEFTFDGVASTGVFAEVGAGYDYLPRGSQVGLRVMGAVNVANTETKIHIGGIEASVGRDWGWLAGAGLVYAPSSTTRFYGVGGYTESDISADISGHDLGSMTLQGWFGEAGVERHLGSGISAKLAARYTQFNDWRVEGIEMSTDELAVMAGLKFNLNSSLGR